MRIKLSCPGILDAPSGPWAVIAADLQVGGRASARARYVLLAFELRAELSHRLGAVARRDYSATFHTYAGDSFPQLIRAHAWNAQGVVTDEQPIHARVGRWLSAEALWVRLDTAAVALADLTAWREANALRPGAIWAPSWAALQGVQAIALASGAPVPGEGAEPVTAA